MLGFGELATKLFGLLGLSVKFCKGAPTVDLLDRLFLGDITIGKRAKLDVALPAGTYECTAYFHNLDPVSGEIIGTAGAIITITIKN